MVKFIVLKTASLILIFSFSALIINAQVPVINSFSPATGPAGSPVTITGSGFDATPANNIVFFGAVRALVTNASSTSITATVPAGATYDPITVNVNGLTGASSQKFVTAFAGGGNIYPGSFELHYDVNYSAVPSSAGVAIADIDADGKPDVGFYEINMMSGDTIAILRNTSTSDSIILGSIFKIGVTGNPSNKVKIYFKDIDGDSKPDIVALNVEAASMAIFRNTSVPGTISFATRQTVDLGGQNPIRIAFGDIDGNGKIDIVAVSENGDLSILKNGSSIGSISFSMAAGYPVTIDPNVYVLFVDDLDNDGKPDIIIGNSWFYSVNILRNTTTGGVISFANASVTGFDNTNSITEPADMDGDGKLDLVTTQFVPGFNVFRNTSSPGNISFSSSVLNTNEVSNYNIIKGDIDGDGIPDMITRPGALNVQGIVKNTSTPGNLSFNPKTDITTAPNSISSVTAAVCDFNLDGKPDILVINSPDFTNRFAVLKNKVGEPYLLTFTPTSGGAGTTITISGYNLATTNAVSIGGIPVSSFTVMNANTVSAIVAAGSVGDIQLTTTYGKDSIAAFNIPVIKSFTPGSAGPSASQSTVLIKGFNFTGTSAVKFGNVPASSFTLTSDTTITATVSDTGASGDVAVVNSYGTGTKAGFYFAAATIVELCPPAASTTLTLNGTPAPFYKWQVNMGSGEYYDISDGLYYSGTTTASLNLINFPSQWNTFKYRCLVSTDGISYAIISSAYFMIKFVNRWNGSINAAWENPANWSCGTVPDANTDVIINSGVIEINSDVTIRSLTISPTATLTVTAGHHLTVLH